jgi:hypothetical protein
MYGDFVDGGVSPFNNPALQALLYVTAKGYRVNWATGENRLMLVSVGTGTHDPAIRKSEVAAAHAFRSLLSLMDDCASLQETLLQWMSRSPTARPIDRELGSLGDDLICGTPLLHYIRYNASLEAASIAQLLGPEATAIPVENLSAMDAPENMDALYKIGAAAGRRDVRSEHFPAIFNLE